MKLVLMTAQIGHYHNARYKAVASLEPNFCVLASQNEADFAEFLANGTSEYPVQKLFSGIAEYREAVSEDKVWQAVQSALDELDPLTIVVAGWATPESFAAISWALSRERRVVMLSESQRCDAGRSFWRERIKSRIVRLCDAALVGGPGHRDYVCALGMPEKSVFMGYDVVDNDHFSLGADYARSNDARFREVLGMPARYFLASARFIPKKNLPMLVRAYAVTASAWPDTPDLVILGDGPERRSIDKAVRETGMERRVHLPGFRGYGDLPALYGLSEGFVHVSTSEQWGLVINEAAAAGVPIVASTACGATQSLVRHRESGFVVAAHDQDSIATALMDLVQSTRERRMAMGATSRRIVANWGPKRFASGLMSALEVAKERPARGVYRWDYALLRWLARRMISEVS